VNTRPQPRYVTRGRPTFREESLAACSPSPSQRGTSGGTSSMPREDGPAPSDLSEERGILP